jgi:hypothetical protein
VEPSWEVAANAALRFRCYFVEDVGPFFSLRKGAHGAGSREAVAKPSLAVKKLVLVYYLQV